MREDEEFAKQAWTNYLTNLGLGESLNWEGGEDPPDYKLEISNKPYVIEVTQITEKIRLGNNFYPEPKVNAELQYFIDELRTAAKNESLITGEYVLALDGIRNLKNRKSKIVEDSLVYMRATQELKHAEERELFKQGSSLWTIQKVIGDNCYIEALFDSNPNANWEVDIEKSLRKLLTYSLNDTTGCGF